MEIEKFIENFNAYSALSYTLYFPNDRHSIAIMESPTGIFQVTEFTVAYDGKLISGSYEEDVFKPEKLKETIEEKEGGFLRVLVNINEKHGGVFVENDQWLCPLKEKGCDDFFVFFQCIPNTEIAEKKSLIFYLYKNKVKYGSVSKESYHLLKSALLYRAKENL